jgi:hypothetical protein
VRFIFLSVDIGIIEHPLATMEEDVLVIALYKMQQLELASAEPKPNIMEAPFEEPVYPSPEISTSYFFSSFGRYELKLYDRELEPTEKVFDSNILSNLLVHAPSISDEFI